MLMRDYGDIEPLDTTLELDGRAFPNYFQWETAPWGYPLVLDARYRDEERVALLTAITLIQRLAYQQGQEHLSEGLSECLDKRDDAMARFDVAYRDWENGYSQAIRDMIAGGIRVFDTDDLEQQQRARNEAEAARRAERDKLKAERKAKRAAKPTAVDDV